MDTSEIGQATGQERNLSLQIDLVNKCNLRCGMCHFADDNVFFAPRVEIDVDRYREMTRSLLPRVRSAMLSCGSEPLMGNSFLDALRATREAGVPFIEFVTNATLFKDENLEAFFEHQVNRMQISIDGASTQIFEDIRVGAKFKIVIRNIRRLAELKRSLNVQYPVLRMNLVLARHNIEEAIDFVQMASEIGANELDLRHVNLHPAMGIDNQSLWQHKALSNFYLGLAKQRALKLGLNLARWPKEFELNESERTEFVALEAAGVPPEGAGDWRSVHAYEERPEFVQRLRATAERSAGRSDVLISGGPESDTGSMGLDELKDLHGDLGCSAEKVREGYRRCPLPFEYMLVHSDAKVVPCPFWTHDGEMGDANNESLEDIWRGELYTELRRSLIEGQLQAPCERCPNLGRGDVDDSKAFSDRVF